MSKTIKEQWDELKPFWLHDKRTDFLIYHKEMNEGGYGGTPEEIEEAMAADLKYVKERILKTFDTEQEAKDFAAPLIQQEEERNYLDEHKGSTGRFFNEISSTFTEVIMELLNIKQIERSGQLLAYKAYLEQELFKLQNARMKGVSYTLTQKIISAWNGFTEIMSDLGKENLQEALRAVYIEDPHLAISMFYDGNEYKLVRGFDVDNKENKTERPIDSLPEGELSPNTHLYTNVLKMFLNADPTHTDLAKVIEYIQSLHHLTGADKTELEAKIKAMQPKDISDFSNVKINKTLWNKTHNLNAFSYGGIVYTHKFNINQRLIWTGLYFHAGSVYSAAIDLNKQTTTPVVPVINKWIEDRPHAVDQNDLDDLQHNLTTLIRQMADRFGHKVITYEGIVDGDNILTQPWTKHQMDFKKIISVSAWVGDNGNRVSIAGLYVPQVGANSETFLLNLQGNEGGENHYAITINIHADGEIEIRTTSGKTIPDPELMLLEIVFSEQEVVRGDLRKPNYSHIYDFLSLNDSTLLHVPQASNYRIRLWKDGMIKLTRIVSLKDLFTGKFYVIDKYEQDYALAGFGAVLNIDSIQDHKVYQDIRMELTEWKGIDKVEIEEWK